MCLCVSLFGVPNDPLSGARSDPALQTNPRPTMAVFSSMFSAPLLLAIGGGLNCQNCETHSYLTHCLQSRPSFKNTLAAGGLVSLTCVYGARAPHDIQRRQKMRGAIKSSLACAWLIWLVQTKYHWRSSEYSHSSMDGTPSCKHATPAHSKASSQLLQSWQAGKSSAVQFSSDVVVVFVVLVARAMPAMPAMPMNCTLHRRIDLLQAELRNSAKLNGWVSSSNSSSNGM